MAKFSKSFAARQTTRQQQSARRTRSFDQAAHVRGLIDAGQGQGHHDAHRQFTRRVILCPAADVMVFKAVSLVDAAVDPLKGCTRLVLARPGRAAPGRWRGLCATGPAPPDHSLSCDTRPSPHTPPDRHNQCHTQPPDTGTSSASDPPRSHERREGVAPRFPDRCRTAHLSPCRQACPRDPDRATA